jgi:hypothetical protein
MGDFQMQMELEQEEYNLSWQVAVRLEYAFLDGYLTAPEFEHVLSGLKIINDWKRSKQ